MIAHNSQFPAPAEIKLADISVLLILKGLEKSLCELGADIKLTKDAAKAKKKDGQTDHAAKTLEAVFTLTKNWGLPLCQLDQAILRYRESLETDDPAGYTITDPTSVEFQQIIPMALNSLEKSLAEVDKFTRVAEAIASDRRTTNQPSDLAFQAIEATVVVMGELKKPVMDALLALEKWQEELKTSSDTG